MWRSGKHLEGVGPLLPWGTLEHNLKSLDLAASTFAPEPSCQPTLCNVILVVVMVTYRQLIEVG